MKMKLQFSLAMLLVCMTVLAVVIAASIRIEVFESDPTKAVRLSRTVSRYPHLYRATNSTEVAIRLAWAGPLAILLAVGVPCSIRFHPRFSIGVSIVLIASVIVWIGFEVHRVQERKWWLSRIEAFGGVIYFGDTFREKYPKVAWEAPIEVYWLRRLLGDRALYHVQVAVTDPTDRKKWESEIAPVQAVFPEALVMALARPRQNLSNVGSEAK